MICCFSSQHVPPLSAAPLLFSSSSALSHLALPCTPHHLLICCHLLLMMTCGQRVCRTAASAGCFVLLMLRACRPLLFASRAPTRSPVCSSPPCSLPPSSALQPSPPADLLPPADTDDTRCFSTPAGAWYRPEPDAPRGRLMSLLMSAHCFFNLSSFLYSHCPPLVRVGLCGHKGALPCRGEHGPHRPTRTHTSCRRLEQPPNRPVHACEPPRAHAAFGKMP